MKPMSMEFSPPQSKLSTVAVLHFVKVHGQSYRMCFTSLLHVHVTVTLRTNQISEEKNKTCSNFGYLNQSVSSRMHESLLCFYSAV